MKYILLLFLGLSLSACKINLITGTTTTVAPEATTTLAPATTVAPSTTLAPTTTLPAPTTTTLYTGAVQCQLSWGAASNVFANFDAALAAAKAANENFCIKFNGNNYCVAAGGCFGPCSSCVPADSSAAKKLKAFDKDTVKKYKMKK